MKRIARNPGRVIGVLLGTLLGGWCVFYVATRFNWPAIVRTLGEADGVWLFGGGLAAIGTYSILRSLRLWVLVRNAGGRPGMTEIYAFTVVSIAFSLVTPGQVGEAAKIEFLHRHGLAGRASALGVFLLERLLDLVTVIGLFAVSLALGTHLPEVGIGWKYAVAFLALGSLASVAVLVRWRVPGRMGALLEPVRLAAMNGRTLALVEILTLASWLVATCGWMVALRSIGIVLGITEAVWLLAVMTLAQILSFVPAGLGVAEVVGSSLLMRLGHDAPQAQAGAMIIRCFGLFAIAYGLAHVPFWRRLTQRVSEPDPAGVDAAQYEK